MYSYQVQQSDIDLLKQSVRTVYCRIELLNSDWQIAETLEGNVSNDNFSCTEESAVRRTYNCDIVVTDSSFKVGSSEKVWTDKYIRVYYGVYSQNNKDVRWYLLGTFSFIDMSYDYSSTSNTLSLSCSDLMAHYNGTKGGTVIFDTSSDAGVHIETTKLDGMEIKTIVSQNVYKITAFVGDTQVNRTIRNALTVTLSEAGITKYELNGLDDSVDVIPYDLEFSRGATYYDVWSKLDELDSDKFEFFFDEEGTFIWRKRPTGYNQDVVLDNTILEQLVVSESISDSFQNIYNATEVWGKSLELEHADRYAGECTVSGSSYRVVLEDITLEEETDFDNLTSICFKIPAGSGNGTSIIINNGTKDISFTVYNADGSTSTITQIPITNTAGTQVLSNPDYQTGIDLMFRYRRTMATPESGASLIVPNFYYQGQYQAHGYYEETDPDVPYSIPNLGRRLIQIIEKNELPADIYCYNQAKYETYKSTAKQDTLSLTTIVIPFLEPGQKIRYAPYAYTQDNEDRTLNEAEWVIKSISWSTQSATMQMELYRFNEAYSYVVSGS